MTDDRDRGVYAKYTVFHNDDPTQRHSDCFKFVLDVEHDPHAIAALSEYAAQCKVSHPALARELRTIIENRRLRGSAP